jgi:hypothetical protein
MQVSLLKGKGAVIMSSMVEDNRKRRIEESFNEYIWDFQVRMAIQRLNICYFIIGY